MRPAPPPSRSPWQAIYGAAHRLRRGWYASRARRLPRPVVSVGNLHWGGTGKTPLVAALAAHLRDRGLAVTILSRGYKRRDHKVQVVSLGEGPLLGPSVAGDEPVLLAGELPGVSVVVGPDRAEAGRHALLRLDPPPQIFVLDDGFSHLRLARDLDLLAFPAADPWAGGRLPPGGRLREPLAAAARANALVLTGAEPGATGTAEAAELARGLRAYGYAGPAFASSTEVLPPRLSTGAELPAGAAVLLVAGIARPERFERAVTGLDLEVVDRLRFPDHHDYPEASLERIARTLAGSSAQYVVTTSKDAVKLLGRIDAPLAEVGVRARPDQAFWTWFDSRLGPLLEAT